MVRSEPHINVWSNKLYDAIITAQPKRMPIDRTLDDNYQYCKVLYCYVRECNTGSCKNFNTCGVLI